MALIPSSKRKPLLLLMGLVVVIGIISGIIFRKRAIKHRNPCVLPMQNRLTTSSSYISYEPLALLIRKRVKSQYPNKIQEKLRDDRYVCTTKECVYIADQIISLMNSDVNPCEDFYSFACGGLETALGKDTNYSVYREQDMHFHRIIRDIVEKAKGLPGSAMQKLKIVYESCMNEESSELNSLQSIQQFLDEIGIPNWPYFNSNFKFEDPPLDEVLGRLYSYGQHSFFTFLDSSLWIDFDSDNATVFRNLTISSQYNFFDRRVETKAVKKVATEILSKWDLSSSSIKYIVEKFAEVDNNILHLNKINKRNHNCATLNDAIHCQYTYCSNTSSNKETLMCKVLKSSVRNAKQENIYPTEGYCSRCYNTFYSENIESVMNNYSDWHLAHYIALRVLIGNCEYLKFSFRKKYKEIFKITQFDGRSSKAFELDKWKLCTNWLINSMQNPLGVLYASEMLSGDIMKDVNDIFDEYQNGLVEIISQQNWIDDTTKRTITKNLRNLTNELNNFVGPYFNEVGEIDAVYQKFQFNPTKESFIRNVLENYKFYVTASSYNPAILKYLGSYNPISMKLFYAGSIVLGLGFLLPPVYKHEFERIFNYAKLGQILAHEFGHVLYDAMMENQDHVDNKTQNNYEEKLRCLRNQFSNFTIGRIGKHVKGIKTLSENFADNLAIKITEKIAQKYLRDMMQKKFSLPGLLYSAEELFYISYSQLWCSVSDIDKEKYSYKVEDHSPPGFRVIGMLQNSDRFSEVFKCPPRTPMNPLQKCSILDL